MYLIQGEHGVGSSDDRGESFRATGFGPGAQTLVVSLYPLAVFSDVV